MPHMLSQYHLSRTHRNCRRKTASMTARKSGLAKLRRPASTEKWSCMKREATENRKRAVNWSGSRSSGCSCCIQNMSAAAGVPKRCPRRRPGCKQAACSWKRREECMKSARWQTGIGATDGGGMAGSLSLRPSTAFAQRPGGCMSSETMWEATRLGTDVGSRTGHCLSSRSCDDLQSGSIQSDWSRIIRPRPSKMYAGGPGEAALGSGQTWRRRPRC